MFVRELICRQILRCLVDRAPQEIKVLQVSSLGGH